MAQWINRAERNAIIAIIVIIGIVWLSTYFSSTGDTVAGQAYHRVGDVCVSTLDCTRGNACINGLCSWLDVNVQEDTCRDSDSSSELPEFVPGSVSITTSKIPPLMQSTVVWQSAGVYHVTAKDDCVNEIRLLEKSCSSSNQLVVTPVACACDVDGNQLAYCTEI